MDLVDNQTEEDNEEFSMQSNKMDDMLASILRDLEFAEFSLHSTSHLVDSSGNNLEAGSNSPEKSETADTNPLTLDFNSISHKEGTNVEEPTAKDANEKEKTCDEESKLSSPEDEEFKRSSFNDEESKLSSSELEEKRFEAEANFEKETNPTDTCTTVINAEISENDSKDQTEIKPQNTPKSNQSENKTNVNVPLPSPNPYINFVQDFKAKYKGHEVTPTMLVTLAMAKWRKMGKEERQVYKNISKSHCEKNKQVEKLKKYLRAYKETEESLFQVANF